MNDRELCDAFGTTVVEHIALGVRPQGMWQRAGRSGVTFQKSGSLLLFLSRRHGVALRAHRMFRYAASMADVGI